MLSGPRIISGRRPLVICRLIGVSATQGPSYAAGTATLELAAGAQARAVKRATGAAAITLATTGRSRAVKHAVGAAGLLVAAAGAARRRRRAGGTTALALAAIGSGYAKPAWTAAGASLDLDYKNGRYFRFGDGPLAFSASHSFARASVADWINATGSGLSTQAAINAPRIDSRGVLIEPSQTEQLFNALTPATQTRTVAAGTYTLEVWGAGSSVALSGGPTGTATPGAPVTFTLGGSTAVAFTVAGSPFAMACRVAGAIYSPIGTAGATATRSAETLTSALNLSGAGTVVFIARAPAVANLGGRMLLIGMGTDRMEFRLGTADATGVQLQSLVGGVSQGTLTTATGLVPVGQRFCAAFSYTAGSTAVSINGGANTTGAPALTPTTTTLNVGQSGSGGNAFGSFIERVIVFPTSRPGDLPTLSQLATWGG